jgi:ribosome biogenesis GTPase / thiamine phosphate phosphatase
VHALDALGWTSFFAQQMTESERAAWTPARVVWEGRERYRISGGDTEWRAGLAGRLRHLSASRADLPAVGDWVLAAVHPGEGTATIHRVLARKTCFSRAAAGRSTEVQIVAANIDTVLIVTSCNRDFNLRRLERYLALAWESGAAPVVVLNKADLFEGDRDGWYAEVASIVQGVPVAITSAVRGDGLADLREIVRSSGTTALLGSSGVGKSTLVNALTGDSRQEVLPIRDSDDRGRHSTTARQLFCLPGGGVLIDTPGMRELQLWDAEGGLDQAFADVQSLATGCRFRDCSHGVEPGCAVVAAVERGELQAGRLDSYHRLRREDAFLQSRHDERGQSERTKIERQGSKAARLFYKLRRR